MKPTPQLEKYHAKLGSISKRNGYGVLPSKSGVGILRVPTAKNMSDGARHALLSQAVIKGDLVTMRTMALHDPAMVVKINAIRGLGSVKDTNAISTIKKIMQQTGYASLEAANRAKKQAASKAGFSIEARKNALIAVSNVRLACVEALLEMCANREALLALKQIYKVGKELNDGEIVRMIKNKLPLIEKAR